MDNFIRLDASDNVVTATRPLEAGVSVENVVTTSMIPRGHKLAAGPISAGQPIRKYAQIIGYAESDIAPGDHIHTHNIEFRNTEMDYEFSTDLRPGNLHNIPMSTGWWLLSMAQVVAWQAMATGLKHYSG